MSSLFGMASAAAVNSNAEAQLVYRPTDWNISAFNALLKKPARIKQVYDIIAISEGRFLNNIKNSLNGLHFGFGIPANAIQVIAALHGPSNLVNYDDYVWQKYRVGEWLKVEDPKTGAPAVRNVFYTSAAGPDLQYSSNDPNDDVSVYQDKSIQGLQSRGVRFLSCHTATEEQARVLVKRLNLNESAEQVVRDLQAHILPGVLIVASMVAAVALLQTEGKYSYITV
jgi:intracellular sulfur oxidation DsrE/DsrF family protein